MLKFRTVDAIGPEQAVRPENKGSREAEDSTESSESSEKNWSAAEGVRESDVESDIQMEDGTVTRSMQVSESQRERYV